MPTIPDLEHASRQGDAAPGLEKEGAPSRALKTAWDGDVVMDGTIEKLLTKLKGLTWTWSKAGAEQAIASLGAPMVLEVPGRSTYESAEGSRLSLYSEGHLAEFVEITLEAFRDPHLLSEVEYEQKADEFFRKFRAAVATATRVLGPPAFNDGVGRDGFPEDQDAVWLALWPSGNSRLMIEQKHEDKELPIRLCIVIAPPA